MKAYKLLKQKDCWMRGEMSCTTGGRFCKPRNRHARKWCAMGAILRCYRGRKAWDKIFELGQHLRKTYHPPIVNTLADDHLVMWWNDHPSATQQSVAEMLESLSI